MFKKYFIFIPAILILTTFTSCGFIKMDYSVAADQFTDFSVKPNYEESPGHVEKPGNWKGPCPANPPVLYPEPVFQVIIHPSPANSITINSWPANPRPPVNNNLHRRGKVTLVQTPRHKRK